MIESKYLKDNMENIQKLLDIPALKHFEIKNLAKVLRLSKIREYKDGEIIIKEGDRDPWLYFLLKGKIVIKKKGFDIVTIDNRGEIFGEMRIIDSLSRSASIYASGKTVCMGVDTSAQEKLDSDEQKLDFLLLLYRIFAEYMSIRLRLSNELFVKTSAELSDAKKTIEELKNKQTASGKTKILTRTIIK